MPTLRATAIAKAFGPTTVLRDVSLSVGDCGRVGVLGPNGTGKTTLLRILAGEEPPDAGSVVLSPRTATVGLLHQEVRSRPGETVLELCARRSGVAGAEAELDRLTARLEVDPDAMDAYSAALDRFLDLGGADFPERAAATCERAGLPAAQLGSEVATLSGGQRARAGLAAVLLSRYDILLLDEPTNDLDFAGLDLLEAYVLDHSGGLVVVSHDREFLERTIDTVVELDTHTRSSSEYQGGFAAFVAEREVARRHEEEAYDKYVTRRDALVAEARRTRDWAHRGAGKAKKAGERDKHVRFKKRADSEHLASKAKRADRKLGRLERVAKPWESWELRLSIGTVERSGDLVATLRDAVVERPGFRLGPVDLDIHWADRVAVTGPNGSGKSTLIAALLGQVPLAEGERRLGPGVTLAELDQQRAELAGESTLLDAFVSASGLLSVDARTLLAKFGLGATHVQRRCTTLSPGERTRALLASLAARGVNCLVLDEPTNHLDLEAIEQLEMALDTFDGTVLLVTHDRRFLDHARVTRVIEVESGEVSELAWSGAHGEEGAGPSGR